MAYQPAQRESEATFRARTCTFRTPGRAGTAGQKLMSIFNPAASGRVVIINQVAVDLYQTAVKAVGSAPPVIRLHRTTVAPTGGVALTRVPKDTALPVGNSVVTVLGDANSDGVVATTALAHATANGNTITLLTQEYAPRLISAAGYEPFDRTEFLEGKEITLRPSEGLLLFLDYPLAVSNPTTDIWTAIIDWYEVLP